MCLAAIIGIYVYRQDAHYTRKWCYDTIIEGEGFSHTFN